MPRANWFFGFPLDGAFVHQLPEVPTSFRRFHADDVHMTLAFLGPCGEEAALRALAVLDDTLRKALPQAIDATLAEVVPMGGSARSYSALSALLDRGRAEAVALVTELRDPLLEAAIGRRDTRPVKPHVTLTRPRRRATLADRSAGLAWAAALDLRSVPARLNRIALYSWPEDRRERLFRIVAERQLAEPPPV